MNQRQFISEQSSPNTKSALKTRWNLAFAEHTDCTLCRGLKASDNNVRISYEQLKTTPYHFALNPVPACLICEAESPLLKLSILLNSREEYALWCVLKRNKCRTLGLKSRQFFNFRFLVMFWADTSSQRDLGREADAFERHFQSTQTPQWVPKCWRILLFCADAGFALTCQSLEGCDP